MVNVVFAHATGTVLARESFLDTNEANQWLEAAIASGRFGVPERWLSSVDQSGEEPKQRSIYLVEAPGEKTYFVTADCANSEPI